MAQMVRSVKRLAWLCLVCAVATSATSINIGRTSIFLANNTLKRPEGCVVDGSGSLYVAEANSYVVRRADPTTAALSVYLGTQDVSGHVLGTSTTAAQFGTPLAMRYSPSGATAYVVDFANNNIYSVDVATKNMALFVGRSDNLPGAADGTGSAAELNQPWDLAVHTDGTMFVTEVAAQRVRRITASGATTHFSGVTGGSGYTEGTATVARYNAPHGVAVSATTVYVADTNNFVIRAVPIATQIASTLAGNQTQDCVDGPVATARFKKPWGLALDRASNFLYVADKGCNTVRRIDLTQMVVDTVVGVGSDGWTSASSSVAAQLSAPNGVCLDSTASKLYVTGDNAVALVRLRAVRTVTLTLAPGSNGTTTRAPTTTSAVTTTTTAPTTTAAANATTTQAGTTSRPSSTLAPSTTRGGAGNVTTSAPEDGSVSSAVSHAAVALAAAVACALAVVV